MTDVVLQRSSSCGDCREFVWCLESGGLALALYAGACLLSSAKWTFINL